MYYLRPNILKNSNMFSEIFNVPVHIKAIATWQHNTIIILLRVENMLMHSVYNSLFFYTILQDIVMNVSQWHFTLKQCKDMIYLQLTTKTKCSFGFANNTEYVLLVKGNGTNNLTSDQTKRHSSDYSTLWHAKPFCNK